MKIIFFGTPEFGLNTLKKLNDNHDVLAVITKPDAKRNRGQKLVPTPIKKFALENNIDVYTPINLDRDFTKQISIYKADVFIVVAYGKILSEDLINSCKYGAINIHASLLPKYRGASPMQQALLNGDNISGVTIMSMDKGLDTGDILHTKEFNIKDYNLPMLHDELSAVGSELIIEVLDNIEFFYKNRRKQNHSIATHCSKILKSDGLIDWEMSAKDINNKVRAFTPVVNVFTFLNNNRIIITESNFLEKNADARVGEIVKIDNKGIYVSCKSGQFVITKLKVSGKKEMNVDSFLRGNKIEKGMLLGG